MCIRDSGSAYFAATVTAPTFSGALSGNAATATTLQTARTIWGQSFNGSANISGAITGASTISASGAVTAGTYNGQTITSAANFTGSINAVSWADTALVTNLNADLLDGYSYSASWPNAANTVLGSGTANYLSKWTGTYTQGNSVIYDNGTNVGIGTTSPSGHKLFIDSNQGTTGNSALKIIYGGSTAVLGEV